METENLRKELIAFVEKADVSLLLEIFNVIEVFKVNKRIMEEPTTDYQTKETSLIPDWHMKEVEERWAKYELGETEMKSWKSVKEEIKTKYGF